MPTGLVESFSLDHTKVKAPFVRLSELFTTPQGDFISKYDLRFTQPNADIMPTGAVHALEHLMAGFFREELQGVMDLSPMGCRTGFYLLYLGKSSEEEIARAFMAALQKVLQAQRVPAANAVQCGNYRDLSLFGAKEYARHVLHGLQEKYQ
ncbi:MAG TPA: S-ribosylhomocysteine lyase [Firmicutes bacterium]|nr:S-ribosylhomocysteine lyase [Bacillota bacterium]